MSTNSMDVPPQAITDEERDVPKAKTNVSIRKLAGSLALVGLLAAGGSYWWVHRGLESTDNAQVDAELVAVPARLSGVVVKVAFEENQEIKKGQVLAWLDPLPAQAKLAQTEAALLVAKANAEAAQADVDLLQINVVATKSVANASLKTAAVGAATSRDQIREGQAALQSASVLLKQRTSDWERAQMLYANHTISKAAYDEAENGWALAKSNMEAARARVASLRLIASGARSRVSEAAARAKQVDDTQAPLRVAQAKAKAALAQVETAKAARQLAQLELSYTKVLAPQDGFASKKTVAVGQRLAVGQSVVQLVTPKRWITANFKETQLQHMRMGQPATIEVDAYPGEKIQGTVESFSGATGARFTLLPPDNATGNFTKVVQRVPVRIQINDIQQEKLLRPGLSVTLTINTRQ
jgi:membrane fusion protein, multidrug efflux system